MVLVRFRVMFKVKIMVKVIFMVRVMVRIMDMDRIMERVMAMVIVMEEYMNLADTYTYYTYWTSNWHGNVCHHCSFSFSGGFAYSYTERDCQRSSSFSLGYGESTLGMK